MTETAGSKAKLRISPSKLDNFVNCPRLFKSALDREDSSTIYTCMGTAAHTVIQRINEGAVLTPDERSEMFNDQLIKECREKKVIIQFPKGYYESEKTIRVYKPREDWVFIKAETKRVLEFPTFDFAYVIDATWTNHADDRVFIEDYKTSSKVPDSQLQLMLYAWAEIERMRRNGVTIDPADITLVFHMLRTGKRHEFTVTQQLIDEVNEFVQDQVAMMLAMQAEEFWPEVPGDGCHFCPRKSICPVAR